ncbi:MAG TPA: hypothetical protein VFI91_07620 [Longimicrobiaceae bacterium]|nr:hypothetical protein [Longimicrobiaceae bacterium]
MRLSTAGVLPILILVCSINPGSAAAQGAAEACGNGTISSIFVDNHSVFNLSDPDLDDQFSWAYRLANSLHIRTREDVIRRELLFEQGDCYDPEILRESERVLRGADYLADIDIFGVRQADGTIHVIVDTQDEWSTRIEPQFESRGGLSFAGLKVREENLLGYGRDVSAFYGMSKEERVYGISYFTPQLFETRWDSGIRAEKTPVGSLFSQTLARPFVGQAGRWAFRQSLRHVDHYFEYFTEEDGELVGIWFPEQRRSFDVGGVFRWGSRRNDRTLLGAALTGEWISYPEGARYVPDEDTERIGPPPVPPFPMDSISSVRLTLLTGQRNVYFVRREGLNTLRGTEDVRLGVETELGIAPSLPGISSDHDLALNFGIYVAGDPGAGFLIGGDFNIEGRRDYESDGNEHEWRDVFAQLDGWGYWRPSPESSHTFVAAFSAVGGWHTGVPFQLTLGRDAGLRGYPRHIAPGGQRVVASVEHRAYLGWPYPELFDLGSVVFADVGRIWAGDAPFGVDSPARADVGVGLRAAFPPGSRQTFRLDVGVPVRSGVGWGDVVISIGVEQLIGNEAATRDSQLRRSARQGISTSLFTYPN